jgi:4-amino-4-deoxy-L-arabinose transferase-like glycosyltransferase
MMDAKRRSLLVACGLIVALGIAYAAIARFALEGFPYSGDEYSMYLQAELFARGLLHAPGPPHAELLGVDHVILDALVRSKYPPGASALLSFGVRAGLPWLVTPIEAVIALAASYWMSRRHFGDGPALVSLLVLGAAPLFSFQAGTFYAHTATTMWLALAWASADLWISTRRDVWSMLTGVAIGCAFVTRPADALFFAAALLVLRSPRFLVGAAVGGAPFAALYLVYQNAQFGSPFASGYGLYAAQLQSIYGASEGGSALSLENLFSVWQQVNHLDVLRAIAVDSTVAGSVVVAACGAYAIGPAHPARTMRNVAVAIVVVFVVSLLTTKTLVDDGARARYLTTLLLPIAFLSAPGWAPVRDALARLTSPRVATAVGVGAVVFGLAQVGAIYGARFPLQAVRTGLYRAIEERGIHSGVVVVRAQYPTRYARNGPFFDRPVLYLSVPASETLAQVQAAFPGRDVYEAVEGQPWRITKSPSL